MSTIHTPGRVTFKEDGDANHYSMLTEDGRWWLAVLANGEQTSELQIANFRRLAACWNRLEPLTTEQIEDPGYDLTGTAVLAEEMRSFSVQHKKLQCRFNQLEEERDQLQQQLEAERASLFAENQRKQQLEQQLAAEREACAQVCDHYAIAVDHGGNQYIRSRQCQQAAAAIRARGQKGGAA